MKRVLGLFFIVLIVAQAQGQTSWQGVAPSIQNYAPLDTSTIDSVSFGNRIHISFLNDSLAWAAYELKTQLLQITGWSNQDIKANQIPLNHVHDAQNQDSLRSWILLDIWNSATPSALEQFLLESENPDFSTTPDQLTESDESYYIWVQNGIQSDSLAPTPFFKAIIVASSVRGALYAVTTMWKAAIFDGDSLSWPEGYIVDYPTFPRRVIGDKYDLGDSAQFAGVTEHGMGLISGARNVLLDNKGNGLIQFGAVAELDSSGNAAEVFEVLREGMDTSYIYKDTWQDLGMDWYQGMFPIMPGYLKNKEQKSAFVRKICRFDSIYGDGRISVVPEEREMPVQNGDFETIGADGSPFDKWQDDADWFRLGSVGNRFARSPSVNQGDSVKISTYWHLQDSVGLPIRQMILEFRVRTSPGSTVEVSVESLMPPDSNGIVSVPGQDDNDVGDYRIFDKRHRKKHNSFKTVVSDTTWQTKHALFYTFGLKVDHPTFYFKNVGTGNATVDFDSVRLYDSDTYFIHKLDSNSNKLQTEFLKLYLLDSTGARVDSLRALSDLPRVENKQGNACDISYGYYHGRIRFSAANLHVPAHGIDSLGELRNSAWKAELWYHAVCPNELPAFFDELNPLGPFQPEDDDDDNCDLYQPSFEATDNRPSVMIPPVLRAMQQFESLWNDSGPMSKVAGYFNRTNEIRNTGWSKQDWDLSQANNWNQADIYGNFNSEIIDTLNRAIVGPDRALLVFADMYNSLHNGQLITRVNNPFETSGYDVETHGISGVDPEQPIVFVDWWQKEVRSSVVAEELVEALTPLADSSTAWEVLLTYLPEPDDSNYWRPNEQWFKHVGLAAKAHREQGYRFTGGGLMYDSAPLLSETWDEYLERISMLQIWWKNEPVIVGVPSFARYVSGFENENSTIIRSHPVPYPEDHTVEIDSVVLQYRLSRSTTAWLTQKIAYQSDSTYDFSISLPDTGGYVEYRVWSFDDLGRYGSFPPYGTKWTDPEAGERSTFTFERRKDDAIVKPDTFWLPGVITKPHVVKPGGKLVFQPLPGYKHSTLYVGQDAKIILDPVGPAAVMPTVEFNGTDTSYIHVKPLCETCKWTGILDSVGIVKKNFVTFHEGTGTALTLKNAVGSQKAQFNTAAFEDTVVVKGPAEITGSVTFNKLIVEPGATLSILPGSEISFFEGGQLIVKKGGHLKAFGNDSTAITFKAAVDSLQWEGIHCEADSQMAACSLKFVDVSGAVAGLLLDRAKGYVENCTFENNKYGILANNGAWFEAKTCSLTTNEVGVVATNLSSVEMNDVFVSGNTGPGLKGLSRASFYLEDCTIDGNDGDGLAGGIGLYTGSCLFMECTEVDANTGSGITAYGGTVMLTSVKTVGDTLWQWQGNRIEHNATIPYEGQITLRNRVALALWNGNNCIWDTTGAGKLVHWEDQVGADRWADVYWGSIDTAAIKAKLPSSVTLVRIDSSRTVCPTFTADNTVNDSLVHKFLFPHNAELSNQYTRADSGYKAIIRNAQSSDYAFSSCDRLLFTNLQQNKSFNAVDDTLDVLYGNVSDASLKRWLRNTKAWAFAEQDEFGKCQGILDSLATYTPVRFDRVAARVQKQMAAIRQLRVNPATEYQASDCIAYFDSAQKILEIMKVWNQTTISDSVVMYAPTTVEGEIMIAQPNGRLTILPHPGAEDPTVRFRGAGSIVVQGFDTQQSRGRFYVQGEADNRVNLDWDSTTAWINIESRRGYINMKHADLKGKGWVNLNEDVLETWRTPIFYADSCTFTGFEDGMWLHGVHDSCTISNCTFESLGGNAGGYSGQGSGLSIAMSDGIQFENCRFVNNDEYGIWTYDCDDIQFNELEVTGSGSHGLMAWNSNNITIECGDFNNNGDTLAEVWVEDGSIDLVDGYSHIADSNGVLVYSGHPSYTDLEDGENGLELYTSSGTYLKSGDTTAVWDITYNAWAPLIPTASGFFNKLYPSNPAKWTVDSSLANFIECGGGSGSSTGGQDLIVIGQDETSGTFSTNDGDLTTKHSFETKTEGTTKSGLVAKSSANQDHHSELTQWRAFREQSDIKDNRRIAIDLGKKFIDENRNSTLIPAAVVQLAALAKRAGSKANLSAYLEQKATETKDPSLRALFSRKSLVARAYEGDPVSGLSGLEKLAGSSVSRRDSICALADAVGIYQAFKSTYDLNPSLAFVKTESLPEFKARIRDLSMQLDGAETAHSLEGNAIPTSYALYQNYPNPFNPSTDIRFDLPEAVRVELKVFNILGQEVVTLVDDVRNAGAYRILWDGKNAAGLNVASGVYVYQIKTGNFQDAKKMVLIR